ncbi:MAG: zinc-binding dehydrogenase [Gammaproteobacteria bacterium]|nr:zinc-binding dehydrogenase [Gammaproteobacteria bacterium]
MQAARAAGAGRVILIEPQARRREFARAVGADVVIDPREVGDLAAAVNTALGQDGADVVFECAGIAATINQSVALARRGGVVSLVGVANQAAEIQPAQWLIKEVRLTSSLAYQREEFAMTQALVADGRIRCQPLHTSTVGLADLPKAFAGLASNPEEIKILVDPRI